MKSATRRWQSRPALPWQPRRGGSTRPDSVATLRQLSPRLRHQVCTLDALAAEVACGRRRIPLRAVSATFFPLTGDELALIYP